MRFALFFMLMCGTAQACNNDLLKIAEWSIKPSTQGDSELSLAFISNADKPIRMIDASIVFEDALGKLVVVVPVERDSRIEPSVTVHAHEKSGKPFERLVTLHKEDVTTYICTRGVVYDDGTKEAFK